MTAIGSNYMPNHRQLFRRSIGEVLSDMLQRRFPVRTAKQAAVTYGVSLPTAENAKKGHASIVLLEKAIEAEGWDFLAAFGREITGQSYEDYLEQKLEKMVKDVEVAGDNITRLRAQGRAVAQDFADHRDLPPREVPAPRRSAGS